MEKGKTEIKRTKHKENKKLKTKQAKKHNKTMREVGRTNAS